MKKSTIVFLLISLILVSAFAQLALAEPSEVLKKVYDAMLVEGSTFSQSKAMYEQYYQGVTLDAALEEDAIAIKLTSENEYVQSGAWRFVQDGDYVNIELKGDDFYGSVMASMIMDAAVTAQGVNSSLFNGYTSALALTEQENRFMTIDTDDTGAMKIRINVVGPYTMDGLDQMVLTEEIMKAQEFEPLGENGTGNVINFGKVSMVINGDAQDAKFLVMEYGGLDDLAFQALISAVKVFQPKGWETFIAEYTELKDAKGAGYTATVNADEAAVKEIIEDPAEGYSCAIVSFGQTAEE